jgi:ABC-2 type transport system ATP-binding protein
MSAVDTMISINGLTKDFGSFRAVDNISFDVKRGEVLGFLGPNGAGKSTTMKMVTGYLPISDGKASVCGFDVVADPLESKTKIGYLPEGAPLYGDMTTTGFLNFIAEIRGLSGDVKKKKVDYAIDKLQLLQVMNQPIDTLSKGFKRRVGFAQAILHNPDVLILDEPTDGLDPNQKHQVRELITEMAAEKAIVISTHILEEVEAVCTRAVIISAGKIVFDDTPAKLKKRSKSGSLDDVFRELTLVN